MSVSLVHKKVSVEHFADLVEKSTIVDSTNALPGLEFMRLVMPKGDELCVIVTGADYVLLLATEQSLSEAESLCAH